MSPHLLLRVHTDPQLGLGHVARAMAVADAWKASGGSASFAVSGDHRSERVGSGLHPWLDAPLGFEAAHLGPAREADVPRDLAGRADVTLLDLWEPSVTHIDQLRPSKVAVFEDEGEAHEQADLLVQPFLEGLVWPEGPMRQVQGRKVKPAETFRGRSRVLRGAPYIVVSPDAVKMRPRREPLQPLVVHRLLVTFGASDGPGLTARAWEVLTQLIGSDAWRGTCTVVAPDGIEGEGLPGCTVVTRLPNLTSHLLEYDAIWCAAGVTLSEALCLGVPAAAWGQNERQRAMITELGQVNGCLNLGLGPEADLHATADAMAKWLGPEGQDSRQEQTRDGRLLVDGEGARRIVRELKSLLVQ